jgi:hypothetical protein
MLYIGMIMVYVLKFVYKLCSSARLLSLLHVQNIFHFAILGTFLYRKRKLRPTVSKLSSLVSRIV